MSKKPLILVVDDLKSNRMIVKKILQNNYDFIEASDGIEAIKMLKNFTPIMILMDAIMPNMNGFETIKKIRENPKYKRTPILMITSLSDIKTKVKALEYGINDFLTKPFDKYELRAICKSYVEMVNLNRQFSDSKINPISKFKNEIALIKDLKPNDGIFLFSINDFHKVDGIYGYKNTKIIEQKFGKYLEEIVKEHIDDISLYHIGNAKFVIKLNKDIIIEDNKLHEYCEEFYISCKDLVMQIEEQISFSPIVTLVYVKDRVNLYEDALSTLSYAKNNNLKYIYCSDDINGIKDIVYSNIQTLKKVKDALNNKKIINYYQPIYDNTKEKVEKYETLVRLECEDGSIMSPYSFLDIAKSGKIYDEITKIVYKNAFDKFKFTSNEFSVNISYLDIEEKTVREYIFDLLNNNPHVSSRVIFEILEDENIKNFGLFKEFITEIKNYGAKIAIDDFGSGFSNFQRIVEIEPEFIKIDGSIVKRILDDSKSYALLESINNFAHDFEIKTVAEFISSKELFDEVNHIGVDFSQGYFLGEPKAHLLDECLIS